MTRKEPREVSITVRRSGLLEALLALSRSRVWFWFWKPSAEEWTVDWYVNPASAWWEQ